MQRLIFLSLVVIFLSACSSGRVVIQVPANDLVEMNMNRSDYVASLNNKTAADIGVAVIDQEDRSQLRGFGLGSMSEAEILVEETSTLVLRNESDRTARVVFKMSEPTSESYTPPSASSVNFTLLNTSAKSIPLLIPSVMNPNLSPFSRSGVDLAFGQEILFRENGRKYVLLVVDDQIAPGAEIDVAKLLKQRKADLGL